MKKTNVHLRSLIENLKKKALKEKEDTWKRIADALSGPTRNKKVVNISKINHYSKENEIIVVPGKVLASGDLNHKITVAAYQFSKQAEEKININGKTMTIPELMEKNIKNQNTRILG